MTADLVCETNMHACDKLGIMIDVWGWKYAFKHWYAVVEDPRSTFGSCKKEKVIYSIGKQINFCTCKHLSRKRTPPRDVVFY